MTDAVDFGLKLRLYDQPELVSVAHLAGYKLVSYQFDMRSVTGGHFNCQTSSVSSSSN